MTDPHDDRHTHDGFEMPPESGARFGTDRDVDVATLSALVGAAFDRCGPCQTQRLDDVQGDPLTVTRLVELAAVTVQGMAGGIPQRMLTVDGPTTYTDPFRELVRAGVDARDDHRDMYAKALAMTDEQRRQAADDAMDLLIGYMVIGT